MDWLTDPFGTQNADWAALPLRIGLGVIITYAGWQKWRRGIRGFGNWLDGLGFPKPQGMAPLVATMEVVTGLFLLAGLATSWIAISLALNMLVATWTQKFKLGASFQGGDKQGYELDILMVLGCVALIFLGAGPLSIDGLLN